MTERIAELDSYETTRRFDREYFDSLDLTIIKVGTSTITRPDGSLDGETMQSIASQIKSLKAETGAHFILVSSGAIGSGRPADETRPMPENPHLRQSYAARGQRKLLVAWHEALSPVESSQHLYTHHDLADEDRVADVLHCLGGNLRLHDVPIVNENDAVSVEEIDRHFDDNDDLASRLAVATAAKRLILLTDTPGVRSDSGETLDLVTEVTPGIMALAKEASGPGRGGMKSKLRAAKRTLAKDVPTWIASGREKDTILRIFEGEAVGTRFQKP